MPLQSPTKSPAKKREEELEKKLQEIQTKEHAEEYSARANKFGLPFSTLKGVPIDTEALNILSEEESRKSNLAVLYKNENKLIIALLDPENPDTKETINSLKEKKFILDLLITTPDILNSVLERYKIIKQKVFKVGAIQIDETELAQLQDQIKNLSDLQNKLASMSVTKLLEILIAGALKTEASDIHFEPESADARLRYRLDGILHDITKIEVAYYEKILNRVKVLSKMKLNIHDAPQDGRFTIKQKSVDIEVRVSILPSEFDETIVMRLLDPRTIKATLEELGMRKDLMELVKKELTKKTGAIMTSGPTGAGKTTTLYAFVNHLNEPGNKIITIEDPIEYHVKNISQTQVEPKKGYTFANGLRAIVRQDPNIILVGEIRDAETAEIALQSALTGHLVLSTIHTNDAAGVVPRLINLGIRAQIIAPAINITIAQRLVRKLCLNCREKVKASPEILQKIKTALDPIKDRVDIKSLNQGLEIYKPNKCDQCNSSGYRGRLGIFEAFVVSKNIEELILTSPSVSSIKAMALAEGMITILQDAYLKLIDGVTSMEEIDRVVS